MNSTEIEGCAMPESFAQFGADVIQMLQESDGIKDFSAFKKKILCLYDSGKLDDEGMLFCEFLIRKHVPV